MSALHTTVKRIVNTAMLLLLSASLSGCATTVGQEFSDIMADIDADCKKEGLGPYLDTSKPQPLSKITNTRCEILRVKPADPLATEEGRFAYSIKLPAPHDKPPVEYRPSMSADSYFKQLCEKAEGDFVFRTVEGVERIQIMRPQPKETGVPLWNETSGPPPGLFVATFNGIYQYVDAVEFVQGSQTNTQLVHYAIDHQLSTKVPPWGLGQHLIEKSNARYGFTFRNSPLENREFGIVGEEKIILDLKTNEVLAFRRRFSKLNFVVHQSAQMMQGTPCRLLPTKDSDNRFIAKILKPATQTN